MDTREMGQRSVGMTWQRGAVWMARSGYGELELSTFTTIRRVAGLPLEPRVAPLLPFPERPAALPLLALAAD